MVKRAWTGLMVLALAACAQLAGIGDPGNATPTSQPSSTTPSKSDSAEDPTLDINFKANDTIDLGGSNCNVETGIKKIVLHNKTNAKKTYEIVAPSDPFKYVDLNKGSLDPLGTAEIDVSALPVTAGDQVGDIVITSGVSFVPIHLKTTGMGGTLVWSPDTTDLGKVQQQAGTTSVITLQNTGTTPVNISDFSITSPEYALDPQSVNVDPGKSADINVTLKGGGTGKQATNITPNTSSVMCAAPPRLAVTGERVDVKVTVSPGDYGKHPCLSDVDAKAITVTNYSPLNGLKWSIGTPAMTKFQVVSGATGTLLPATDATTPTKGTIMVKPNKLPGMTGAYDDTLQVSVQLTDKITGNPTTDPAVNYPATMHVDMRGVVLQVDKMTLNFVAPSGQTQKQTFVVNNNGNEDDRLYWDFNRTKGGPAWVVPGSSWTFGAFPIPFEVTYSPGSTSGAAPHEGTLTARMNTDTICNGPIVVTLTGNPP